MLEFITLTPIHQPKLRTGTLHMTLYMYKIDEGCGFVEIGYTTQVLDIGLDNIEEERGYIPISIR